MNELIARVKGMVLAPAQEWRAIQREPIELVPVFTRYVMILAAIPAIASMLLLMAFGLFFAAISAAIVSYILSLVAVVVTAKIVEILAPKFGGPTDADAALKLAAFAPTVACGGDHRADSGQPGGADQGVLLAHILYLAYRSSCVCRGKALTFTRGDRRGDRGAVAVRLLTGSLSRA